MNKRIFLIIYLVSFLIEFSVLGGGFSVEYHKPNNPKHQKLYKTLKRSDAMLFGDAVEFLNKLYGLSNDIRIVVGDCGFKNSRYNYDQMTVYICYETLQNKIEDYRKPPVSNDEYYNRVFKNSVFTFWHEIGHVLIHQFDLPINDGELNIEDLADEFAVLSMIWRKEIKWTNAIVTSSLHFKNKVIRTQSKGVLQPKFELHSSNNDRYYYMTCLLYGAKPKSFERLKQKLDKESKGSGMCKSYYLKRVKYWFNLLQSHTKYGYFK